ncbi:MAG: M1 family aminopeptidase [Candidatus Saccharimonadales bacterium]
MHGLYPSVYKHGGQEKTILSTQLEASHAREVLPCIDEPEAKATFTLSLTIPKNQTALSNTPVKKITESGKLITVDFETTPKMSTYLLAFAVGNFEFARKKIPNGPEVRVYAAPGHKERLNFALKTATKFLNFYNDYFGIAYPLEKLDLVAIPSFGAGAMENWGLITFREEALLIDEEHSSLVSKQQVASVIAHEIAHQWFGNLVTMDWWTDLWLNEGFASFMECYAVDAVFPKWKIWEQFVSGEYTGALRNDSLLNTHPVEVPVDDPEEINEIFDEISYHKGASIIRMLHNYLGDKDFRRGLKHYLKKYSYANAQTAQLWQALEEKSNKQVVKFMEAWTKQSGHPVVTVNRLKDKTIKLQQHKFIASPLERKQPQLIFWPIPINSVFHKEEILLTERRAKWNTGSGKDSLKLNQGQSGFYQVNYSPRLLKELLPLVGNQKLEPIDRLGLLSDSFEMTRAGLQDIENYLDLLYSFKKEDNPQVWNVIYYHLATFLKLFGSNATLESLVKSLGEDLTKELYKKLGWTVGENDSEFTRLLRRNVLALSLRIENKDAINTTYKLFNQKTKNKELHPDIRGIVYQGLAKRNTKSGYNDLLKLYRSAMLAEERNRLIGPLCSYEDKKLFKQSLGLIKDPEVKLQEKTYWISSCLMNRHNNQLAWSWLQNNWEWYLNLFRNTHDVGSVISSIGYTFQDKKVAREVAKFFDKNGYGGITRSVDQAIETIKLQAEWVERDQDALRKYLVEN